MKRRRDVAVFALALEAWITTCLVWAKLLLTGRNRVFARLRPVPEAPWPRHQGSRDRWEPTADRVKRGIAAAMRRLPTHPSCVVQALVAARMLGRRRIPAVLIVGVRPADNGGIESHCWVRAGDVVVCGGYGERHFRILAIYDLETHG